MLGAWVGACGVRLQPLVDALKQALLDHHVLHADETPVAMLKPGTGKTHCAYLWAYTPGAFEGMKAVCDFADSRAGQHTQDFLGKWRGALVCDDYSGYKAMLAKGVVEAGCLAHARRKFVELHTANKSHIAETGTALFETNLADPAQLRKILANNGAPMGDLQMAVDPGAGAAMRALAQLSTSAIAITVSAAPHARPRVRCTAA